MKQTFKRGDYFAHRRLIIVRQDKWTRHLETAIALAFTLALTAFFLSLEWLHYTGKL